MKEETKLESMIKLANHMQNQLVQAEWELERIRPMKQKEFEKFQGSGAKKDVIENLIKDKILEREQNLKVILKIIEREKTQNK